MKKSHPYLTAISQRVLVYDGAMGTNIQALKLPVEAYGNQQLFGFHDVLTLNHPQAVENIHRAFLEAGVDVIETNTFRSNRITLAEVQLADQVVSLNRAAAQLSRRIANEYSRPDQPRFVAGSMGPTGKLPSSSDPELSKITFDQLAEVYREQATGLIQGGVDLLLLETSQDILEVKAAIFGIQKAFADTGKVLPIQVQITLDTSGHMLLGTDISAALTILSSLPIDVFGLNCSTGPEHMREPIRYLSQASPLPIVAIPNAGLPINVNGEAIYPLQPEPFADSMLEFVQRFHVNVVGGCCGTTPQHLKSLVDALKQNNSYKISFHQSSPSPALASAIQSVNMKQEPPPLLIGERCNAQGSRDFKRLLLAEDYEGILSVARQQVDNGAHALDISVAVTERTDEVQLMINVIRTLTAAGISAPLVIDTTELAVMEAALKTAPGRCLLNSTHLEGGKAKAEAVFKLAKTYNAAVILLTIDEEGMAKTAQRKLAVAQRLYKIAVDEFQLQPQDLVFDCLTFTLASGDPELANSAIETMEGIRLIKQNLPGVFTSLGVSNLSFGLAKAARPILNSVFLYHCLQAGLDMAIVNPAQITPYADIAPNERELAENLIFNRHPEALQNIIEYFSAQKESSESAKKSPAQTFADLPPAERLRFKIIQRIKDGIETDIDELIQNHTSPSQHLAALDILNNILLPAMKQVGDDFGAGKLILPFVLQSAEAMKKAVTHLEQYLERDSSATKGKIVLATVYGDVHDIGKNLVKTILSNNGYTVIDLGKQVPGSTIIEKAIDEQANAIGLSALLVSTSQQMPLIVNELARRKLSFPVLIGGAAINRRFGYRTLFTEDGEIYPGGVFYCKDAFEGLSTLEKLMKSENREQIISQLKEEALSTLNVSHEADQQLSSKAHRSEIQPLAEVPIPPFWGAKTIKTPLSEIWQTLPIRDLFRLSWGAKNTQGEAWEKMRTAFEARLKQMQREAEQHHWLNPQAVYGYFPCQSEDNRLIIYDHTTISSSHPQIIAEFSFPRQPSGEHLCLADYFNSTESGKMDIVALQVVTMGEEATQHFEELEARGEYSEAYYFHGLAVQSAEAYAEYLHRLIRSELNLPPQQGKRYSWGYAAIPSLEDHRTVFNLLPAEKELGMSLTAAFQLVPEQSTAAIIVHHPQAKYFSIGKT